eukprot:4013740-Pyramimonas_sp.AAC.1
MIFRRSILATSPEALRFANLVTVLVDAAESGGSTTGEEPWWSGGERPSSERRNPAREGTTATGLAETSKAR